MSTNLLGILPDTASLRKCRRSFAFAGAAMLADSHAEPGLMSTADSKRRTLNGSRRAHAGNVAP